MKAPGPRVSDHAVLRFLEREGGLDVEAVRRAMAASIARAVAAADRLDGTDYRIVTERVTFVVTGGTVVTVVPSTRR
ncbi:hypothetical protein CCR97_04205 [Rhodoplanes elegans]|uniref:Uncharacterized protein n=1 Tax=Rhodoplanes elegans TaxID=29408 RepID=A0A327KQC5_9BRAD|nr:hypothetical protein [Rhodoplanes elegans]MBK5957412.1 hypothetical protein [Rhodoplanes elegans]RAI39535.1 hypothetical protein CH338_09180 [Rhodoplanes elegans]